MIGSVSFCDRMLSGQQLEWPGTVDTSGSEEALRDRLVLALPTRDCNGAFTSDDSPLSVNRNWSNRL